jgi:hypothetical protein
VYTLLSFFFTFNKKTMANHVLSLEAPSTLNCSILRIIDTSVYDSSIPIECPILNITLPGFNYSVEMGEPDLASGFSLNLTACNLEVQTSGCGTTYNSLPDGVYVIKYSVSPNDQVYVEYNHLRTTSLRVRYNKILCDLDLSDCKPNTVTTKKMNKLKTIDMYIQAAIAKVETCHDPKKGMQLYTYAKKLLAKFDCITC